MNDVGFMLANDYFFFRCCCHVVVWLYCLLFLMNLHISWAWLTSTMLSSFILCIIYWPSRITRHTDNETDKDLCETWVGLKQKSKMWSKEIQKKILFVWIRLPSPTPTPSTPAPAPLLSSLLSSSYPIWKYVKCLMNLRLTCVKSSNPVESNRLEKRAAGVMLVIFFLLYTFVVACFLVYLCAEKWLVTKYNPLSKQNPARSNNPLYAKRIKNCYS